MGYTHYWRQRRDFTDAEWAAASADIAAILKHIQHVDPGVPLGNESGAPGSSPVFTPDLIAFNGLGNGSYETMLVERSFAPKHQGNPPGWWFCKTAHRPYDVAVVAVLCYLAKVAKTHVVESDGQPADWRAGLHAARDALPQHKALLTNVPRFQDTAGGVR